VEKMMVGLNYFIRAWVVGAMALAASLLVLVETKPAQAAFPGENGKIAFASYPYFEGVSDIYVMNPDGSNPINLTNNSSADDSEPAFSPDARKIAFMSNRDGNQEIYVMDANGSNQRRLTNNAASDSGPSFSADGSKIVFVSNRHGNKEIYTMGSDGSNQIRLTGTSSNEEDPAFSPDGSKIAFTSDGAGNQEIYVMGSDGSNQRRLTNNPASDSEPTFSPDGSKIAFTSDRDGGDREIYAMNQDGSGQTNLTNDANTSAPSHDSEPAFSPDGSKIAFASYPYCPEGHYCGQILSGGISVMRADGSGLSVLSDSGTDSQPNWGVRQPETPPPGTTIDTTPPETTITSGPSGPTNDNSPTFSFSGSDNVSPTANLLYSYKVDSGQWSAYSSATSVTLGGTTGLSEGPHTFYVKAKDEVGNEDGSPAQRSFTVDSVAPTGAITINDGASRTRSLSVTLTLSASDPSLGSGISQMRISNTQSGLASAPWEAYATRRSWTLSSGSGTKTVYVQYRDGAANLSVAAQDTIQYKP